MKKILFLVLDPAIPRPTLSSSGDIRVEYLHGTRILADILPRFQPDIVFLCSAQMGMYLSVAGIIGKNKIRWLGVLNIDARPVDISKNGYDTTIISFDPTIWHEEGVWKWSEIMSKMVEIAEADTAVPA